MSVPTTMQAVRIQSPGVAAVVSHPVPSLPADRVLVKVVAVALNPTDWKHVEFASDECSNVGCDFAGLIVQKGAHVRADWNVGDRIAGWTFGSNNANAIDGSFAEYAVVKDGIGLKIPENVTFEEAATLGVGISTVGQGLYQSLELPLPTDPAKEKISLLIYGGSTATGTLAIQFAKMSGLQVITTCSPRNFDLVKSLGADAVFDYNSPSVGADIRAHTKNKLYYAYDCIAEGTSPQICADALSSDLSAQTQPPKYCGLLSVDFPREEITPDFRLAYTIFGEPIAKSWGWGAQPASPDAYEFGVKFWKLAETCLAEGKFKVHPLDSRNGGLQGVIDGMKDLKDGKVSGKKLVYRIAEPLSQ